MIQRHSDPRHTERQESRDAGTITLGNVGLVPKSGIQCLISVLHKPGTEAEMELL